MSEITVPDPYERPTISIPEAGKLLGLERSTAYDAAKRGDIPILKIGRRKVVPTARLLDLLGLDPSNSRKADPAATGSASDTNPPKEVPVLPETNRTASPPTDRRPVNHYEAVPDRGKQWRS